MDYNVFTRKRGKGYQYTLSYKVNEEWKTKSKQGFKKESEAKRAGQALARDLNDFVPQVNNSPAFKETAKLWHLDGSKSAGTIRSYNSYLNTFEKIHKIPLNEIRYQDITEILQEYQADHKFNSVKAVHRYGKMVFNFAIKKLRIVNRNIFDDYELKPPKQSDVRPVKVLTTKEINGLIDKAPNPNIEVAVAIIGLCGLRGSEAIAVTRADIKDGYINVWHQLQDHDLYAPLKTTNSYRMVKISERVKSLLNAMPLRLDGRIAYVSLESVNTYLSKHGITSHHLRHSYATNLIALGVDFKTAADMIGDTVQMVMSTYSHVNAEMRKSAEDKIMENF